MARTVTGTHHLCQAAMAIIVRFMRFSSLIPISPQRVLAIAMALMFSMTPMASAACSFSDQHLSPEQVRAFARQSYRRANAVIDAEVVMPMNAGTDWKSGLIPAATLKVIKVWKGHISGDMTLAVYVTSCDIVMERKGQRFRILLTGSDIFHAEQGLNGAAVRNLAIFNTEIDRIVGSPRPRTYAGFPGEEPAPRRARLAN